jgi:hypothetical protein
LLGDVDTLTQFEADYRARLSGVLEDDLAKLRERPSATPGPVPQGHDVELPAPRESFAAVDTAPDSELGVGAVADHTTADEARDDADDQVSFAVPSEPDDAPPTATAGEQPVTDFFGSTEPSAETVHATRDDDTLAVDTSALFDADAPAASSASPAEPALAPGPSFATDAPNTDAGFDMLRPDALDAEVLDDDAFFATLREAVHDDSPLGPREEGGGEDDFYGDEGERASFRDVFRRRR